MTKRLLYLNGLSILMIPLQHAGAYGLQALFVFMWTSLDSAAEVPNYSLLGSLPFHVITVIRQFSTFSVPAFMVISGLFISFFARGKETKVTWGKVLPRVKILLYPFFLWTVFRFLMLRSFPRSLDDVLGPYHFVPLLIQYYLISPWLVKMAKERWKLLLVIFAILHLGFHLVRYTDRLALTLPEQTFVLQLAPRWLFFTQSSFWFPLGVVIGLHTKEFFAKLGTMRWKLFFATLFFFGLTMVEYYVAFSASGETWQGDTFVGSNFAGIIRNFYILFMILWLLSLDETSLPFRKLISDIGTKSLGIYMGNIPAIYAFALLMFHFTPYWLGNQLIYLSILFSAGLGIPLLLMYLVRNSPLRPYYRHLFG